MRNLCMATDSCTKRISSNPKIYSISGSEKMTTADAFEKMGLFLSNAFLSQFFSLSSSFEASEAFSSLSRVGFALNFDNLGRLARTIFRRGIFDSYVWDLRGP